MNPLALLILLGGGWFLYTRLQGGGSFALPLPRVPVGIDPRTGYPLGYDLSGLYGGGFGTVPIAPPAPPVVYPYPRQTLPGNANPTPPAGPRPGAVGVPVPVQVGIGAGTAIGGAAVAGTLTAGALAATGIGAAGAILAWAIASKGLFRGGEEGIFVNPARDAFLANFATLDQWRDNRNPQGFSGLAALMHELTGSDAPAVAVFQASTRRAFEAAVDAVATIGRRDPARTQTAMNYLRGISPFR